MIGKSHGKTMDKNRGKTEEEIGFSGVKSVTILWDIYTKILTCFLLENRKTF